MTTLHPHLHALFMLQPRIRAALRQRWSDSCPGRLDDAMGNLWLDMVTHQDRYLSVPAEGRLAYCIRVAHYSMRGQWRQHRRWDDLDAQKGMAEDTRMEQRLHANQVHRHFLELLPGAAEGTCRRHAGPLAAAVREYVEEGTPAPELARRYGVAREYIPLTLRQVRSSLSAAQ